MPVLRYARFFVFKPLFDGFPDCFIVEFHVINIYQNPFVSSLYRSSYGFFLIKQPTTVWGHVFKAESVISSDEVAERMETDTS